MEGINAIMRYILTRRIQIMKPRCLFPLIIASALIVFGFQINNLPENTFETSQTSINQRAQRLIQQQCSDTFPIKHSVRIFSDGREVRHIAFLKVHKTASGTTASIFFRFGVQRGLTFILPRYINIISVYNPIEDALIYPRLNKSFDIMTSHVIYDRVALAKYLYPDTVYIGILREPYLQFKSSMNYMQPDYVYNISKDDPIQQYLKNPIQYEPKNPRESWINNRQSVEFGFPNDLIWSKNSTGINDYINKLDKEFKLVIIVEYFDESVILMRRMLGWQLKDILYQKLHVRHWDREKTKARPFDRKLYRNHAAVDYALYGFFYNRLFEQINQAGENFYDEVLHFKKVRQDVEDFCNSKPNGTMKYLIPYSQWNMAFVVDIELCSTLYTEEEQWVEIIRKRQYNM